MSAESGIVIIDKPAGVTSHHVVGRRRRLLGTRKVGHAGTLDPMATGVLILGVNRATRLLGHLALHDKRYLATVRLGQSSTTDDADGEVVAVADASGLDTTAVEVSRLEVVSCCPGDGVLDVGIDVECSSGTYVRAIARDLGKSLGVGGHLVSLRRVRIGGYDLSEAVTLGEEPPGLMPMAEAARRSFPCVTVDSRRAADVGFGRRLDVSVPAGVTGIISPEGALLALYRPDGEGSRPVAVLV